MPSSGLTIPQHSAVPCLLSLYVDWSLRLSSAEDVSSVLSNSCEADSGSPRQRLQWLSMLSMFTLACPPACDLQLL